MNWYLSGISPLKIFIKEKTLLQFTMLCDDETERYKKEISLVNQSIEMFLRDSLE